MVVLWDWDTSEIRRTLLQGTAVFPEHLPCVMLCARHWGSRVSQRDPNLHPGGHGLHLQALQVLWQGLPDVFRSLGLLPQTLVPTCLVFGMCCSGFE